MVKPNPNSTHFDMPTPFTAIHRWLADEPPGLGEDRRKTFLAVNYSMVLGLLCHISFATLFLVTGHMTLVVFNLAFSIPVFGICIREAHKGHSTNAMTLSTVELLAHAWFVSVHIGAETAFFMYPTLLAAIYPMMTWFGETASSRLVGARGFHMCSVQLHT